MKIEDGEWCGDMGELGASCFHTLSEETRDVAKVDWDHERFGMVCTQPVNFGEWKKAILKLCKLSRRCSYDAKMKVVRFNDKVQSFVLRLEGGDGYNP